MILILWKIIFEPSKDQTGMNNFRTKRSLRAVSFVLLETIALEFVFIQFVFEFLCDFFVGFVVVSASVVASAGLELFLVRVRWVPHAADGVVVGGEAVDDAAVEGFGGFRGGVHVHQIVGLHVLLVVVNGRVQDPVPHRLAHDKLGRRRRRQPEPVRHVPATRCGCTTRADAATPP